MVGLSGFEPLTSRLSGGRSNQLSYRPIQSQSLAGQRQSPTSKKKEKKRSNRIISPFCIPLKGGDPAARSRTATLLRLHPNHQQNLWHLHPLRVRPVTSGSTSFRDVTGGVYKARERIHRGVADPRLLAIPPSCRRVAACNLN